MREVDRKSARSPYNYLSAFACVINFPALNYPSLGADLETKARAPGQVGKEIMRDRRSPLLHPSSAVGGGGAGAEQRASERGTSHAETFTNISGTCESLVRGPLPQPWQGQLNCLALTLSCG